MAIFDDDQQGRYALKHRLNFDFSSFSKKQHGCQSAILNMRIAKIGSIVWGMMFYLSAKFDTGLTRYSKVVNTNVSKFGVFSQIFGRKSQIFSLKIKILKIRRHG